MLFKAKAQIQICQKISYESGNKCGKFLAKALREQVLGIYIPHIMTSNGQKCSLPKDIVKEFQRYYTSLCNLLKDSSSLTQTEEYLVKSQMPKLSLEISKLLDKPFTLEEIQNVIGSIKGGKAPGPDGLTITYYKTLMVSLGKFMHKFFNSLGPDMTFPRDTLSAYIAVIPKEGKDPTACGSYRPI